MIGMHWLKIQLWWYKRFNKPKYNKVMEHLKLVDDSIKAIFKSISDYAEEQSKYGKELYSKIEKLIHQSDNHDRTD
jgi:uncharacterized protein Yka (UPF0111/DUF47 family)